MDKPILINSDEILLVVYGDDQHIGESGPLDESQVLEIIDEADDTVKIFRVNPSEKSCEDISEEIAEVYVQENGWFLDQDRYVHPFIRESDAYEGLLNDLSDEKYNDEMFGTYEQQHRLRLCDVI
ncbi:hypothetical protein LBE40_03235 [Bartonella taylorii]|uniref:Uncharacterized protein n=1 Tax=Bartonella taylorii 8TBB TaxID=1094560 RepID=A0A9P2RZW9_BARTA|nr:hypothetical protein [Bartonella taylorii]EJF94413.1 hypothetical protein ME9_00997 [Bartonella taylorii 8TBB]USP01825.1 hypothetical protein LBE40_03235 [Bartonella taylorii]